MRIKLKEIEKKRKKKSSNRDSEFTLTNVNVFPLAVCPYANTTLLYPSMAAHTCPLATLLYTGLLSEPVRIASKLYSWGEDAFVCWDESLMDWGEGIQAVAAEEGRILVRSQYIEDIR